MDLGTFYFVLANLIAVVGAAATTQFLVGSCETWRRLVIGISAYGLIVHSTIMVAGIVGMLTPSAVILLAAAIATALLVAAMRLRPAVAAQRHGDGNGRIEPRLDDDLQMLAAILLVGALILQFKRSAFNGSVLKWDDVSYHATVTAQWIVDRGFSIVPATYQSYYPFGAEMLSLWFMLPYGDDAFVSLAGFYWFLLAASAIYGLVRLSGGSAAAGLAITAVFAASPKLVSALITNFSANDMAAASCMMAAVALMMPQSSPAGDKARPELIIGGLLAGMAIGCKVTYAVPVVVLFSFVLIRRRAIAPGWSLPGLVLCFFVTTALTGGYWYLRNWVVAGNPLFPAEFGIFGGPFDAASQEKTKAWTWLMNGDVALWQLRKLLNWPFLTGLLAVAGYTLFAGRGSLGRLKKSGYRVTDTECVLFIIGIAVSLAFLFSPFSGTSNRPYTEFNLNISARYALVAVLAGLVLSWRFLDLSGFYRHAGIAFVLAAYMTGIGGLTGSSWSAVLFFGALLLGFGLCRLYPLIRKYSRYVLPTVAIGLFAVLGVTHKSKFEATTERLFATGGAHRPVGQAWRQLEKLPQGSRVAFFMSQPADYTNNYPLFGRHLQLVPVYVEGDGLPRIPLHALTASESEPWWHDWGEREHGWGRRSPSISAEEFIDNLRAADVEFVIASQWSLGHWPPQQSLLQESGQARLVYNDGYSAIWRIVDDSASRNENDADADQRDPGDPGH